MGSGVGLSPCRQAGGPGVGTQICEVGIHGQSTLPGAAGAGGLEHSALDSDDEGHIFQDFGDDDAPPEDDLLDGLFALAGGSGADDQPGADRSLAVPDEPWDGLLDELGIQPAEPRRSAEVAGEPEEIDDPVPAGASDPAIRAAGSSSGSSSGAVAGVVSPAGSDAAPL